jgi:hypothetical protein
MNIVNIVQLGIFNPIAVRFLLAIFLTLHIINVQCHSFDKKVCIFFDICFVILHETYRIIDRE